MDPPGIYPIIAVSAGLRWLTKILVWRRGSSFVSRVAATVLHQKIDSSPKVENYSIYLLFFDLDILRRRYCANIDRWFGVKIYFRIDKEPRPIR